jgi:hypothetical protein
VPFNTAYIMRARPAFANVSYHSHAAAVRAELGTRSVTRAKTVRRLVSERSLARRLARDLTANVRASLSLALKETTAR